MCFNCCGSPIITAFFALNNNGMAEAISDCEASSIISKSKILGFNGKCLPTDKLVTDHTGKILETFSIRYSCYLFN